MKRFEINYEDGKELRRLERTVPKMNKGDEILVVLCDFYNYYFDFKFKKISPEKFLIYDFYDRMDVGVSRDFYDIVSYDQLIDLIKNQSYKETNWENC